MDGCGRGDVLVTLSGNAGRTWWEGRSAQAVAVAAGSAGRSSSVSVALRVEISRGPRAPGPAGSAISPAAIASNCIAYRALMAAPRSRRPPSMLAPVTSRPWWAQGRRSLSPGQQRNDLAFLVAYRRGQSLRRSRRIAGKVHVQDLQRYFQVDSAAMCSGWVWMMQLTSGGRDRPSCGSDWPDSPCRTWGR